MLGHSENGFEAMKYNWPLLYTRRENPKGIDLEYVMKWSSKTLDHF